MVLFSLVLLCFLFCSCCVIRVHDNRLLDNHTTTTTDTSNNTTSTTTLSSLSLVRFVLRALRTGWWPSSRPGGRDEHGEHGGAPDVGGAVEPSGGGGGVQYAGAELVAFGQHVLGPSPSAWRYVTHLLLLPYSFSILLHSSVFRRLRARLQQAEVSTLRWC